MNFRGSPHAQAPSPLVRQITEWHHAMSAAKIIATPMSTIISTSQPRRHTAWAIAHSLLLECRVCGTTMDILVLWPRPLTSDLENLLSDAHSCDEYVCPVSLKSLKYTDIASRSVLTDRRTDGRIYVRPERIMHKKFPETMQRTS